MNEGSPRQSWTRSASRLWARTKTSPWSSPAALFYETFKVNRNDTQGNLLYALGDGQWDIPALRVLLEEECFPEHGVMEAYQVEHEFPSIGWRTMVLEYHPGVLQGQLPP